MAAIELWEELGHVEALEGVGWPEFSPDALAEDEFLIVVQVDGKLRGKISVSRDADEHDVAAMALADERVAAFLGGRSIRRVVQVPGRLVNIVLER